MFEFFSSIKQAGVEQLGKFQKSKRKCKRIFRKDILRVILGCNSQEKQSYKNPVPITLVFQNVQASTTMKTISDNEEEEDGEDDNIVGSNMVLHSKPRVKDKRAPESPASEESANKLLTIGVTGLSPMTIRRSPSSPSLHQTAKIWRGGVADLRLPSKLRTIPGSKALDDMGSDPALLDAIAMAASKPAVQLNRSDRLSHRRSHSIV